MRSTRWLFIGVMVLATGLALALLPGTSAIRAELLAALPDQWVISLKAWRHGVTVQHESYIVMPDGARIATSVYLPRRFVGRLPTVLVRVPYGRKNFSEGYESAIFFASNGYAALVQDLRGTGESSGELLPWRDAGSDGAATLKWIGSQSWSNGRVGTFGCSALGESQFPLAARNEPGHAAMIASGAGGAVGAFGGRHGYFGVFEGGVFQLASGFGWFVRYGAKSPLAPPPEAFSSKELLSRLPVIDLVSQVRSSPNGYSDFLSTPLGDPRWHEWGYVSDEDKAKVPGLIINTWGDQTVGDTLALAESWKRSDPNQRVVIAPGNHCGHANYGDEPTLFGELSVENAGIPWKDWYLEWFDRWLRDAGDGLQRLSPYTYFMLVENRWYGADRWPPTEAAMQQWFLGGNGSANSAAGDGRLSLGSSSHYAYDEFTYDPRDPVPTRGGPVCCTGDAQIVAGPADRRVVESRRDVLVYTSSVLRDDVSIAGPIRVWLTLSTDVPDTDVVARLVDVWPGGRAISIQEGALRLRYRNGINEPTPLVPGRRYDISIDLRSIAYQLKKGHRLRLDVTSSSFPRLERNLNTGSANNATESRSRLARTRVHHGPETRSYLEIYVLRNDSGEVNLSMESGPTCPRSACSSGSAVGNEQAPAPADT